MKLKKAVMFKLANLKKPVIMYYGMLFACILVFSTIVKLSKDGGTRVGGLEMTSFAFLFIMGLCSFRSELYVFLQNGLSRKTVFLSYAITSIIISGIMAMIEAFGYNIIGKKSYFQTAFQQIYDGINNDSFINSFLVTFGWCFGVYLAASILGYFIAVLYYRMNKALKYIVSIGVPLTLIYIIPLFDQYVLHGVITRFMIKLCDKMMGIDGPVYHPLNWMISCIIIAGIVSIFSYMLSRKAVVKNR